MVDQLFADLDWLQWRWWIAPTAGLLVAVLALALGYLFFLRRRAREAVASFRPPDKVIEPRADPFVHGSATERREALRRKGKHIKVLIANADGSEQVGWSWVLDRSMTGLCLKVDQEVPAGTILSVRPLEAPEGTPWIQVEVKNCRPMDIHWELGCHFVRPPAWSVLLLFG